MSADDAFYATLDRLGRLAAKEHLPAVAADALSVLVTLVFRGSVFVSDGAWRGTVHSVRLKPRAGWTATLFYGEGGCAPLWVPYGVDIWVTGGDAEVRPRLT